MRAWKTLSGSARARTVTSCPGASEATSASVTSRKSHSLVGSVITNSGFTNCGALASIWSGRICWPEETLRSTTVPSTGLRSSYVPGASSSCPSDSACSCASARRYSERALA